MTDYNQQEGVFLQKIMCDGDELDLSFLKLCVLIETLDLAGPKLILKFWDPDSILRDDMAVGPQSELESTFADYWNTPEAGGELVDRFTVMTMPVDGEVVTLNCMQSDIYSLKTPAAKSKLFVGWAPESIARALLPGIKLVFDRFSTGSDYHMLSGERPSKTLRQMAREMGACLYYQRGTLHAPPGRHARRWACFYLCLQQPGG